MQAVIGIAPLESKCNAYWWHWVGNVIFFDPIIPHMSLSLKIKKKKGGGIFMCKGIFFIVYFCHGKQVETT